MPRTIEVSVPAATVDDILQRIDQVKGVVGLSRQAGASLQPPGDILSIQTTNDASREVIALLAELDVLSSGSIVTSEPRSIISPEHQLRINRETNETVWDEMAFLMREDTNVSPNFLASMFLAGGVAAAGLWSDTLHVVVGAMLIAPAFEPLLRVPFGGLIGPGRIARSGLVSTGTGYLLMLLGGVVALVVLQQIDPTGPAELRNGRWVQYWSTLTPATILTSTLAAAAGAVVISGQRSALTTGVMIALALVPSMALVGMALAAGDPPLAGDAFVRWGVDAVLVMLVGGAVLAVKRLYLRAHPTLT
jgi:hypothetical protein